MNYFLDSAQQPPLPRFIHVEPNRNEDALVNRLAVMRTRALVTCMPLTAIPSHVRGVSVPGKPCQQYLLQHRERRRQSDIVRVVVVRPM